MRVTFGFSSCAVWAAFFCSGFLVTIVSRLKGVEGCLLGWVLFRCIERKGRYYGFGVVRLWLVSEFELFFFYLGVGVVREEVAGGVEGRSRVGFRWFCGVLLVFYCCGLGLGVFSVVVVFFLGF